MYYRYQFEKIYFSDKWTESCNFDSLMLITAALDNLAIFLSSLILGNKVLTLRWIKSIPLELKYSIHFEVAADHHKEDLDLNLYRSPKSNKIQ